MRRYAKIDLGLVVPPECVGDPVRRLLVGTLWPFGLIIASYALLCLYTLMEVTWAVKKNRRHRALSLGQNVPASPGRMRRFTWGRRLTPNAARVSLWSAVERRPSVSLPFRLNPLRRRTIAYTNR